jgi:hypothetical protein
MPTLTMSTSIGGLSISGTITRTDDGEAREQVTLAAGKAGTITGRTDNDTGVATLSTGHGIITSDVVDVYWSGGIRRGMTATVATNAVTIDGGAGDNLPVLTTAVVVCKQTVVTFGFTAANAILAAAAAQYRASVQFQQSDGTAVKSLDLGRSGTNGEAWYWANQTDVSTPFGANVGKVALSNGNSSNTNVVKFGVVLDNG